MKRHILAAALIALVPFAAHADTKDAYSGIGAIPGALMEKLARSQQSEQQYVTQVISILRNFGRNQTTLDQQDIDNAEAKRKRDAIKSRFRSVMTYDANFDLKVTEAEILEAMGKDNHRSYRATTAEDKARLKNQVETRVKRLLWEYDTDKDGVITAKEVGTLPEGGAGNRRDRQRATSAAELLALDPDKDGVLTVSEIESLAHKAWRTVDKNGDSGIDADEWKTIAEALRKIQMEKSGCVATPASAKEKLVFVTVTEGGGISDVSVAGQLTSTGTVRLEIEKGTMPVYLVAVAGKPVIWQVTGDTARVNRMIVSGPLERPAVLSGDYYAGYGSYGNVQGDRPMQAGVVGLEKDKVRFLKGEDGLDCAHYLRAVSQSYMTTPNYRTLKVLKSKQGEYQELEAITGRKEDFAAGAFEPSAFRIDADKGEATAEHVAPEGVPEGLDTETWERALKFVQGGLVSFKGQTVVSDSEVEPYKILPGWAGVAQLVKEGALKAEKPENAATRVIITGKNTYKMVVRNMRAAAIVNDSDASIVVTDESRYRLLREIDNYPPGLDGAYGVHFVVPKGIKMPEGKAGSSCVYSEEKEEMTGLSYCY